MTPQAIAKAEQGYTPKAVPRTCVNCTNFAFETVSKKAYGSTWTEDTNLRCKVGGFAVKKMGSCNLFEMKQ